MEPARHLDRILNMPRYSRVCADGLAYHIVARGCARMTLFFDDLDRRVFLGRVKDVLGGTDCRLLAYCLMDNHVHLVVRQGRGSIGSPMQRIFLSYAQYFNKRHERVGHVFQNRFFSRPCLRDGYLMTVVRYIHLNPVKAGMVPTAADWPWSSHREYMGMSAGSLCSPEAVLGLFDSSRREFAAFVEAARLDQLPADGEPLPDDDEQMPASERFQNERMSLDALVSEICRFAAVSPESLQSSSKARPHANARRAFVRRALQAGYRASEIARFLGLGESTISMIIRRSAEM